MKFALRNGINVICEKPLVLNTSDLDALIAYEKAYGASVNSIFGNCEFTHPILALRDKVQSAPDGQVFDVELTYMTSRGKWYMRS